MSPSGRFRARHWPEFCHKWFMAIVVQKYGGSSVADADKLRAVAQRVMRTTQSGHQVVVVVSAMGDTTDDLLQMAKKISANPERRELDMLLSVGERISMALLSMAIRELGGDAISFTGSQAGIITNDRHVDARIIEVRPFRVQDELARGKVVIIAGYQGMSYRREVTTLGRGGSDTTAVAMAAALDAQWCEICSDVDGVYSADPRVVPAAKRIAEMTYEEMQEMAEAGAKVLNAQAVEFAKERGVAIYARATAQTPPEHEAPADGTVVRKFGPRTPGSVVGVASEKDLFLLQADAHAGAVLEFLDSHQACGKQLHISGESLSMVLSRENIHEEERIRRGLAEQFGAAVRLTDDIGAVSVIGAGINTSYRNLLAGSAALAPERVHDIATSSFRITWLLPVSGVNPAVQRLHEVFLEKPAHLVP